MVGYWYANGGLVPHKEDPTPAAKKKNQMDPHNSAAGAGAAVAAAEQVTAVGERQKREAEVEVSHEKTPPKASQLTPPVTPEASKELHDPIYTQRSAGNTPDSIEVDEGADTETESPDEEEGDEEEGKENVPTTPPPKPLLV